MAKISCGQSDTPMEENGQLPCILPSGSCIITAKLKKIIVKNDVKTNKAIIFFVVDNIYINKNSRYDHSGFDDFPSLNCLNYDDILPSLSL